MTAAFDSLFIRLGVNASELGVLAARRLAYAGLGVMGAVAIALIVGIVRNLVG